MRPLPCFLIVLLSTVSVVSADITYDVTVDTSSISGTAGSLDFNFNPGPLAPTQAASLQILNFTSDGSLVNCAANVQGFCGSGDVSGTLPGTLTFDNGAGFNDYFDGFTFGSTLSFAVDLYGPALVSPDGVSASGSAFAFSIFSDTGGTVPTLTTDTADGFATIVDVNLDGSTTVNNSSSQTSISPVGPVSAVPEPNSVVLLGTVMILGLVLRLRRRVKV